jgi:type II secretory pathway component PulJ
MSLSAKRPNAFSLVEVTLALGVAAVSLLAIFALLPVGVRTNQIAIEQTASTDVLSAVAADLRATLVTTPRGGAATSPRFGIAIPSNPVGANRTTTLYFTGEGRLSTTLASDSRYRVSVTFLPNGVEARTATFAHLNATWPAPAAPGNAEGAAEMFVALDRN